MATPGNKTPNQEALDLLQILKRTEEQENRLLEIREQMTEGERELFAEMEKRLSLQTQTVDAAKDELELQKQFAKALGDETGVLEGHVEIHKAKIREIKEQIAGALKVGEVSDDLLGKLREENEQLEGAVEKQKEYNEEVEAAVGFAKGLGKSLGLAGSFQGTLLGKMQKTTKALKNNKKAQKEFKEQMAETFTVANILSSIMAKIAESTIALAFSYDKAATSFNAQTGAAGEYNSVIASVGHGNEMMGITMAEAGEAAGALHSSFAAFTTLSKAHATSLTNLAAKLGKLGIDGQTFGQNLQFMTKVMGLTTSGAEKLSKSMAEWDIGVSPAQLAKDFAAAGPQLAQFGNNAMKVFKGLAKQAKATGVAMSSLIGIAEGMDTFEGAAAAAGKLNALLGGPFLNSVELLTASYEDKITMIKESLMMSGKEWDTMNRFEKKAIAQAAGFSNVAEAAAVFGNEQSEVDEKQKKINDMIEKAIPIMEKLKGMMAMLAIQLQPQIDQLSKWISNLGTWIKENKEAIKTGLKWAMVIGSIVLAVKGLLLVIEFATVVKGLYALATGSAAAAEIAAAGASVPAAAGIGLIGTAASMTWPQILALGAAFLMMGGGIALAAFGLSFLADSMKGMGLEAIMFAVVVGTLVFLFYNLVPALGAAAFVAGTATIPFAAFGVAMLKVGAGLALAGAGVWLLAEAFMTLKKVFGIASPSKYQSSFEGMGESFFMIASAVGILTASLIALGLGFAPALVGLGLIAGTLATLAISLALIKTDDLQALATLSKAISEMTEPRAIAFKASMDGLEGVIDAADSANPVVMNKITRFVESIIEPDSTTKTPAPKTTVPAGARAAAGRGIPPPPTEVILELNDREFARAVIKVMDKKLKLNMGD